MSGKKKAFPRVAALWLDGVQTFLKKGIVPAFFLGICFFRAEAQSPIEQLTVGPLHLQKSLFAHLTASSNVDQLSKQRAREANVRREDVYLTYGGRFSISGTIYPDIDLNFSTSISREKHFIRTDLDENDIPFLGNAIFDFNRNRGHLRYGFNFRHSASTEREKQEVFVPAARRLQAVREIEQITNLGADIGWSYERLTLNNKYNFIRTRFNKEFADGDEDEQIYLFSTNYQLNRMLSLSLSHGLENTKQVGQPGQPETGWLTTSRALINAHLLQRPNLTYSVGFEKEDEEGRKGKWDPTHLVSLSDFRNIGSNLRINGSATYTKEKELEADDIGFVYNLSITHQMPYNISQTLAFVREPVDTFGSTVDSDQTTYSYSITKARLFLVGLSVGFRANREITKPKLADGTTGPTETLDEKIFNVSWVGPKRLSRWLSLRRDYQYIFTDSSDEGTYDEHRLTLGVEITL